MSGATRRRSALTGAMALGLTALIAGHAAAATNYYYDANGRLVASTRDSEITENYAFDGADNRSKFSAARQSSPTQGSGWLYPNQSLNRYQSDTSGDGRFFITRHNDGNVVLYWNGHGSLWATNTSGTQAANLVMQGDGNLVLYDAYGNGVWSSGTAGHPNAQLAIQSDGNLVIYSGSSSLWSSNTGGH